MIKYNLGVIIFLFSLCLKPKQGLSQFFEKENFIISAGAGVPNMQKYLLGFIALEENYKTTGTPVYHVKIEYAIAKNFGIGLSTNYAYAKLIGTEKDFFDPNIIITNTHELTSVKFNLRANYHFLSSKKFDTYIGGALGFGYIKYKYWSSKDDFFDTQMDIPLAVGFEASVGLRYYPVKWIGLYTELGISKSIIQGGICIKIKIKTSE